MSGDQNSGEKTENATPKRLRDARRRGDVPKSRDVTNTLGLAFTLVLFATAMEGSIERLAALVIDVVSIPDEPFELAARRVGQEALSTFLTLSSLILLPIASFGLLVEFLQNGPILALDKVQPKLENLDPIGGIKKMLGIDNLVEVFKSVAKTVILFVVAWTVVRSIADEIVWLPYAEPGVLVDAVQVLLSRLLGWTLGIFAVIMLLDAAWQQHSYARKMKMSLQDIKQEHKDSEGDPQVKGQRKQMHKEFTEGGNDEAARDATVLVVNPVHVAIALRYDPEDCPVPVVTAKGEEALARSMRKAAGEAHVPVVRNERLARLLLADVEAGDMVPARLFDVIAEVMLWATRTNERIARTTGERALWEAHEPPGEAPGEDLTDYPSSPLDPMVDDATANHRVAGNSMAEDTSAGNPTDEDAA